MVTELRPHRWHPVPAALSLALSLSLCVLLATRRAVPSPRLLPPRCSAHQQPSTLEPRVCGLKPRTQNKSLFPHVGFPRCLPARTEGRLSGHPPATPSRWTRGPAVGPAERETRHAAGEAAETSRGTDRMPGRQPRFYGRPRSGETVTRRRGFRSLSVPSSRRPQRLSADSREFRFS